MSSGDNSAKSRPCFSLSSLSPLLFIFSPSFSSSFLPVASAAMVDDVTCRETPAPRASDETQLNCLSDRNEAVIATLKCAVRVSGVADHESH